jgi:hypothetical protein
MVRSYLFTDINAQNIVKIYDNVFLNFSSILNLLELLQLNLYQFKFRFVQSAKKLLIYRYQSFSKCFLMYLKVQ